MSPALSPARPGVRWLVAIVLVLGIALVAGRLALPKLVEQRLRAALASAGLADARFNVHIGLGKIVLTDVVLDEGVVLGTVDLSMSIADAFRSRVDEVTIRGARIDVAAAARLLRSRQARPFQPQALADAPLSRLRIVDSTLVATDHGLPSTAISGLVTFDGGAADFELLARGGPAVLRVGGQASASDHSSALATRLHIELDSEAWRGRARVELADTRIVGATASATVNAAGARTTVLGDVSIAGRHTGDAIELCSTATLARSTAALTLCSQLPDSLRALGSLREAPLDWRLTAAELGASIAGRGRAVARWQKGPVIDAIEGTLSVRAPRFERGSTLLREFAGELAIGGSIGAGPSFLTGIGKATATRAVARGRMVSVALSSIAVPLHVRAHLGTDSLRLESTRPAKIAARTAKLDVGKQTIHLVRPHLELEVGPMSFGATANQPLLQLRWRADGARWRTLRAGPVEGRIAGGTTRWSASATVTTGSAPARLGLDLRRTRAGARGLFRVDLPRARYSRRDLVGALALQLAGIELEGMAGGSLQVPVGSGEPMRAEIELAGVELRSSQPDIIIGGLTGRLAFADVAAARTEGLQELRFASASGWGRSLATGGVVSGHSDRHGLCVARAEAGVAGGQILAEPFCILQRRPATLRLRASGLQLGELVARLARGKASGQGILDGDLELRLGRSDGWQLEDVHGNLRARGAGRVRVFHGGLRASLAAGAGVAAQLGAHLSDTLRDFEYASLRFDVAKEAPSRPVPEVRVQVHGRGVRTRQELRLVVNVRGIRAALTRLAARTSTRRTEAPTVAASRAAKDSELP